MAEIELPKKLIRDGIRTQKVEEESYAKELYRDFLDLRADHMAFTTYLVKQRGFTRYRARKFNEYLKK